MVQHEKMIAMGQMVAGITHEIANPLASMDSLLQLAERRPEKLNAETAKTLRDQIRRISAIISQMKEMAHPRHSEPAVTDVNQLAEQAIRMVQFDPRSKNVSISLQAGPDVGSIRMVPQAMQQVLVNLLINALDAVAEVEDRKVIVRTERRDGAVYIEVIDNGTGIPEQHLRRLFEPFFTTKPVGKGTGLGLSISYGLVEKQGGTIAVRSTPGQGATFIIKMPAGTSGGAKPARGAISRLREGPESGVAVSEKPQG
jgi:signal transduction histidine kinase